MEEAVDADIAEADAEDEDEEAVDMDEAGEMGEEFDFKWSGTCRRWLSGLERGWS